MTLPDALLAGLSDFVAARLGLDFPPARWKDLERGLQAAATELGFERLEQYAQWLIGTAPSATQLEMLASKLTVGETYFFREPQAFAALREHVIRPLAAAWRGVRPHLRVWCAGCCTGEEPYSLAIFLERQCPELRGWRIDILGTDINPDFLRKARAGIYRAWSFRDAPPWLLAEYFSRVDGDSFELRPDIKRMVSFEHLNLAEDSYPALHNQTNGLDLIFCRNVLMYFTPAQMRRAIEGFRRCLVEDGHLVVSVCETSPHLAPEFRMRSFAGVTFYQKSSRREAAPAVSPAAVDPADWRLHDFPLAAAPMPPEPLPTPAGSAEEALLAEARALIRAGDYPQAATRLEALLTRRPHDGEAASLLARALANQGRLADARRWIERAIAWDKLQAPLHHLRATVLQEMGEHQLAAHALERALYLEPDFVLAHVALADLARRVGRAEKSQRHLAHALRVLRRSKADELIAEAEGLTAGRLIAIIEAMSTTGVAS